MLAKIQVTTGTPSNMGVTPQDTRGHPALGVCGCQAAYVGVICGPGTQRGGLRGGAKRGRIGVRLLLYGSFLTRAMNGCRASTRRLFFCAGRYERGDRQLSRWLSAAC